MTPLRSVAGPQLTEAQFQAQVVQLMRHLGWRTMHVRRSIGKGRKWATTTSVEGWPDICAWKPGREGFLGRFLVAELKSERGKLSAEQEDVLASLEAAGVETYVWKPSDLDEIARILGGRK